VSQSVLIAYARRRSFTDGSCFTSTGGWSRPPLQTRSAGQSGWMPRLRIAVVSPSRRSSSMLRPLT
jgi:hypothetical protein